jgi:hypothetical protein
VSDKLRNGGGGGGGRGVPNEAEVVVAQKWGPSRSGNAEKEGASPVEREFGEGR